MSKMKTFMIYLLIIVGFFFVSVFLEGKLLEQMYVKLNGSINNYFEYNGKMSKLDIEVLDAKATRINGYITARITNNSNNIIKDAYLKIHLLANERVKAMTRYLEILDLKPGESRDYTLKFQAGYVDTYMISLENDFPDKDYIFEIFGYEFNTRDVFGLDLSKYINAKAIKDAGFNGIKSVFSFLGMASHRFVVLAKSVPLWGYVGALAVIAGII